MKCLLAITFLILSLTSFSQNYPDLTKLKETVNDSLSENYYPNLMKRYMEFDSSLTFDDYILIYYGFGLQPRYNGYRKDPMMTLYNLFNNGEYSKVLKICDSVLQDVPVCISSNFYKGKVIKELYPDSVVSNSYLTRSGSFINVLYGSGDGKSKETAYKILFLSDEKRILMGNLGINGYSMQRLTEHYDVLTVKKSSLYRKKLIYFDVYLPLNGFSRLFK